MGKCREEILRTVKQQNMHQINTHTNIPNYQNRTNFKFQPNITANTYVVKDRKIVSISWITQKKECCISDTLV